MKNKENLVKEKKFNINLVKGKTGSGKTLWIKSQIVNKKNIKILYFVDGTYKNIDALRISPVCKLIDLIKFINVENSVIVIDDLIHYKKIQNLLYIVNIFKPELFIKNHWYISINNSQDIDNKDLLWLFDYEQIINFDEKELRELAIKLDGN